MRKYLLPEKGSFYKANLHCHTTVSDGRLTPEEVKRDYMAQGYSVVAFTDHEVMVAHPELGEEGFLPLNGYEMAITESGNNKPSRRIKTCHICLIALEPDNLKHVCRNPEDWEDPDKPREEFRSGMGFFDEKEPPLVRTYTPECINEVLKRARERGFFATYNHPTWSLEDYSDYMNYHGMHAMEICNYGCIAAGYPDYNEHQYDDMLRGGERIFCVAADDNHNLHDRFGGFTVIKAEKLEYRAVTRALEAGNFYASQGPEITELWFEDGKVHIGCSDADRIFYTTGCRRAMLAKKPEGGRLNSAEFEVLPGDLYFRITMIDEKGYPANTNAYFTDELF